MRDERWNEPRQPKLGCGLLLVLQRTEAASGLCERGVEQISGSDERGLHGTGGLGQQYLSALEIGELTYLSGGQRLAIEVACLHHQKRVCLGEVTKTLCDSNRVTVHEGESGRTRELVIECSDAGTVCRNLGQRVLRHGVRSVLTDVVAEFPQLCNREAAVLGEQNGGRLFKLRLKVGYRSFLGRHGAP